jgi:hypothetical protein
MIMGQFTEDRRGSCVSVPRMCQMADVPATTALLP